MTQYRIYNRYDLSYIDGGDIRERQLDYDYLDNNESTVKIMTTTEAEQGDIIALIETHGVYCAGCITSVDNVSKKIKFKDLRELISDNVPNPFLSEVTDDGISRKCDVIATLKQLITDNFVESADPRQRLPLKIRAYGTYEAVWTDDGDVVDLSELYAAVFEKYNIVLSFSLDFDRGAVMDRWPHIEITIAENTAAGHIVKDNIFLNEFQFSAQSLPDYNACVVFDGVAVNSVWYLRADNTITDDETDETRLLPRKTTSAALSDSGETTAEELAAEKLIGNIYNHFVSSKIDRASRLLRREEMAVGDLYKIILSDGRAYDTVYTGWKDAGDNYITLIWGKTRIDFTAKLKKILRRLKSGS